jgi:TusA-related sulfurtransferase
MAASHRLDLTGVPCPLSWAKAKVALADLACGDLLELTLDDPRGARDLPRAAEAEGHHVVSERALAAADATAARWVIVVEK